jgi:hypothetical protein
VVVAVVELRIAGRKRLHNPAPKGGSSAPAFQWDKEDIHLFIHSVVRPDDTVTSSGIESLSDNFLCPPYLASPLLFSLFL